MIQKLKEEAKQLMQSDRDPIDFAIEAIRLNLVAACYKDEKILLEAMTRLKKIKD